MQVLSKIQFRFLLIIPLMLLVLQSGIVELHHHMDGSWYDQTDPLHRISSPASRHNGSSQKRLIASYRCMHGYPLVLIPPQSTFISHSRFISPAIRSDVAVGNSTRNRAPPA
ncbi:MAG: hypothetical protein ACOYL3_09830 [Desulfuromonadaceae bacterium]